MVLIERALRKALGLYGYDLVQRDFVRPVIEGSPAILGSFEPLGTHALVGRAEDYFIHGGYHHRTNGLEYDDDSLNADRWQLEVYRFAREICDRDGLKTVCDIGCGSGYKLLHHLGHLKTIGLDVERTCARLRQRWPDRHWMKSDFDTLPNFPIDLVIASDVIEHLVNPDSMLEYIRGIKSEYIILSTPDRNLMRDGRYNGPPLNPSHVREWSFAEFDAYIGSSFEIPAHFISYPAQATQCVLCRSRP